jgi:transmembrane sensor
MSDREPPDEIEDAATVWAAKAEHGLSAGDQAALDQWLEGDSRRLGAFVRAQAAWIHAERASSLGDMPEGHVEIEGRLGAANATGVPLNRRMVVGGGAAIAASLAAAYLFGVQRARTLESNLGEIRRIALAGGSTLVLDTDTRVDVGQSSGQQILELIRGRLFLDTGAAQGTPLAVRAGDLLVEATSAAFSLQNLAEAPILAIVTRGTLVVSQAAGIFAAKRMVTVERDHVLTAVRGEPLRADKVQPIATARREQFLAWREGILAFGGEPLGTAVRAFDRYGPGRIIVSDPELAEQRVVGLFKADDPRGFAEAIAASLGARVSDSGQIIRISPH